MEEVGDGEGSKRKVESEDVWYGEGGGTDRV